jgi:hypothetical protein
VDQSQNAWCGDTLVGQAADISVGQLFQFLIRNI